MVGPSRFSTHYPFQLTTHHSIGGGVRGTAVRPVLPPDEELPDELPVEPLPAEEPPDDPLLLAPAAGQLGDPYTARAPPLDEPLPRVYP